MKFLHGGDDVGKILQHIVQMRFVHQIEARLPRKKVSASGWRTQFSAPRTASATLMTHIPIEADKIESLMRRR
jgi:hypothetical protein